jgi:hypothetical protein
MKRMQQLVWGMVAGAVALAMVSTVAAQTVQNGGAKVIRVKGPARYMVGGGAWQPLKVGMVLTAGSVVQTGKEKGSCVDLALSDPKAPLPHATPYKPYLPSSTAAFQSASAEQNVVRVLENSALGIDKLTYLQTGADVVTDTQLDLRAGRIFGSVPKLAKASKYEIKLPNGVAGIRGTKYIVGADGTVVVLTGMVVLAYVDPATGNTVVKVISASQAFSPVTGAVGPASPEQIKDMQTIMHTVQITGMQTSTYSVDQTTHWVSPTRGQGGNSQGENNNNQGGNGQGGNQGGNGQ